MSKQERIYSFYEMFEARKVKYCLVFTMFLLTLYLEVNYTLLLLLGYE
jgi:hypothetical protein